MRIKRVSIGDIEFGDQRFCVSYFFLTDSLVMSIREVGLIYPPIVTLREKRYIPVSGWKRLLACRKLLLSTIPVFICKEKDDLSVFRLAVFENLATRKIGLIEKAEIVGKLIKFGEPKQKVMRKYLPLLGIPPTYDYFDLYLRISRLNKEEKRRVQKNGLHLRVVEGLVRFPSRERRLLFPMLPFLSQNKQRELLEMVQEISLKNGIAVEDLFSSGEFKTVINSKNLSPVQKAEKVNLLLKKKRFPLISARLEAFESSKNKLAWPDGVRISPTPFFEEKKVHVWFSFKTKKEYLKKLTGLREASDRKFFTAFLESLSDE
ncbi:MAG: ParB N-terminal domain-containing protein [Candidatus Aminicenantes bacterium]|jgi:hypothetical protein